MRVRVRVRVRVSTPYLPYISQVIVPDASKLTLGDLIELFKREHKLVLQARARARGRGRGLGLG